MRYGSCVLAVVLMAPPIGQDSKNQESSADGTERVSCLETLWNEAHRSGGCRQTRRPLGGDLVVTVSKMPVMTKIQAITIWRSGRMKFRRYETSELRARRYGDAAVVTGRLRRSREVNGREIQDDWRFTKVYVRGPASGRSSRGMPRNLLLSKLRFQPGKGMWPSAHFFRVG